MFVVKLRIFPMLVVAFLIAGWAGLDRLTFNNAAPLLAAFILLIWRIPYWSQQGINALLGTRIRILFLLMFAGGALIGFAHGAQIKDIVRDLGSIACFVLFFLYAQSIYSSERAGRRIIWSIIVLCALLSIEAIIFAGLAALAGVGSYLWRGEYIPAAAEWIIYGWTAALFLLKQESSPSRLLKWYFLLMLVGVFASLSRTNILLVGVIYLVMSTADAFYRHQYLKIVRTVFVLAVLGIGAYYSLKDVPVFQERITATTDADNDQSIGWRLMEHEALFADLQQWTPLDLTLGRGLGYRLPLPSGVTDFDGRPSIPYLHDSYATIFMKFGAMGLLFVIFAIFYCLSLGWKRYKREANLSSAVGALFLLLIVAKALTLQGLSSYQNLMFVGISAVLAVQKPRGQSVIPLGNGQQEIGR